MMTDIYKLWFSGTNVLWLCLYYVFYQCVSPVQVEQGNSIAGESNHVITADLSGIVPASPTYCLHECIYRCPTSLFINTRFPSTT